MVLTITYDLHNPTRNYVAVESAIKSKAGQLWAHPQGSVWFVDTLDAPDNWVTHLRRAGDPNDEFFVCRLQQHWSSINTDAGVVSWLKQPSRRW